MRIGLVSPYQHESIIDLLCEINAYYNPASPAKREVVREHSVKNLLSPSSPHELVVAAREDGSVVGLAVVTLAYSIVEPEPERRAQCQLKELYVSNSQRSQGTGRSLMCWVAKYAMEHGCSRIDWPVKASNALGIAFYEGLGAKLVEDRLSFRLAGPELSALAKPTSGARGVA